MSCLSLLSCPHVPPGIIDEEIQKHNPRSHTIVEAHPDIHARMLRDGWGDKPGVRIVFGRWQDVVGDLGPFDGIFWDTYGEFWEDFDQFQQHLPRLLRRCATSVYTYFNGFAPDNIFFHLVYGRYDVCCAVPCTSVCPYLSITIPSQAHYTRSFLQYVIHHNSHQVE